LALADFTRVIELDPTNASAYNSRGNIHQQQGNLISPVLTIRKPSNLTPI
jgi:hypothetical protein